MNESWNGNSNGHSTVSLQIDVVSSDAEFAALAEDWEALQAGARVTSVFETFDWQHLWWRHYGRGRPLRLLLARSAGALVGILPLFIDVDTVAIASPVRLLRFVGTGGDTSPDDLGPILAAGRETEIAGALADAALALPGWDVLSTSDLQPENAFGAALAARATTAGLATRQGRSERIAYLTLPESYEAWLRSLHRDRRYRVRHIRKKLAAAHPARFFVWDDSATLPEGIDTLVRLHLKRWRGRSESFSSPEYIAFHGALMAACLERDRLRLYCLEISGAIAAMYYFYRFRGRVYLMQSGFDPDLAAWKPGQVLLGHVVEHAIGEKHEILDFLRGDHRYKDELATGVRQTVFCDVFRPTLGAYLYRTRRIYLPAVKARLGDLRRRLTRPAAGDTAGNTAGDAAGNAAGTSDALSP
jgi:CelD/BcsL family acetyltransferase involved in cellulose biosynthesis